MRYQVFKLRDPNRPGSAGLLKTLEDEIQPQLNNQSIDVFGMFPSLLGLASNEVYLVTRSESSAMDKALEKAVLELKAPPDIIETTALLPTIRPTNHGHATKAGVYVFRWFTVEAADVDEIVRLSGEAWPSFEADFDAEIQGLFVEQGDSPDLMLLITWYKDLAAWQASRAPSPEARENFLKRHRLTKSALPIATQLHVPGEQSMLLSHR